MREIYEATLDDIRLSCETIEDTFSKSIATYEFPYKDGAMLEDMGQRAHAIRIRCYFLNEDYENHKALIQYLDTTEERTHELIHPQYGIILGQIESVHIYHDDREETAEIDLVFIEELRQTVIEPEPEVAPDMDLEEDFGVAMADIEDQIFADMQSSLGSEAWSLNNVTLDWELPTLIQQFSGISTTARSYVRTADQYVAKIDAMMNNITNPANSLLATMEAPITLSEILARKTARMFERYALLGQSLIDYPDRFAANFQNNIDGIADEIDEPAKSTFAVPLAMAGAHRVALETGTVYALDQENERAWQRQATGETWSLLGKRTRRETIDQPMTVTEIETELAVVRTLIQTAVTQTRYTRGLKDMAAHLTVYAIQVKADRPRLSTVRIDNTLPLHLICLKYGRPYTYAEILLAVNGSIRQPSFVKGEVNVYDEG